MKVTVIGAGAAGLSTAILVKRLYNAKVTILERAKEVDSLGLGVALLQFAINDLKMISLGGFLPIEDQFILIGRVTQSFAGISVKDEILFKSRIHNTEYWGVKRATILSFLKEAAHKAGVKIEYDSDVSEDRVRHERTQCDLLVGTDGAGSIVRSAFASEFNPKLIEAKSRYAWLELDGNINQFVFGYIYVSGKGLIRITAYPHSKTGSSAIITHSMELTRHYDDDALVDHEGFISEAGMKEINGFFAAGIGGRRLSGKSRWRRFRAIHCQKAASGNVVLVGDAYTTLHYETGWGTSAALQASRILGEILGRVHAEGKSVEEGLKLYNSKSIEISRGLIAATTRTMREIDGQSTRFRQLGSAKFLEQGAP
jgi:anthraniloyl-CoA monooxygenase